MPLINAGVQGNERADSLAGDAAIDGNLTLDPTYCYPVCDRPSDDNQASIFFPYFLLLVREGSSTSRRRGHLRHRERDPSPSESTTDGNS